MATQYYKLRGRAISVREYWRLCNDPFSFAIAVLAKPFGGLVPAWSVPLIDRIPTVELVELPQGVTRIFNRITDELEDDGYRVLFYTEAPLLENDRLTASSVLLANDGRSLAQILYTRNGIQKHVGVTIGCARADGGYAAVSNRKQELNLPPGHMVERYPKFSAKQLLEKYRERVREWESNGQIRPIPLDEAKAKELLLRVDRESIEFHISRGILAPMTAKELKNFGVRVEDDE